MSTRSFEQAVQLFQQGQREEAARMFQILVQDAHLPANVRASAYIWLAETNDHVGFKVQCYQQALQLEPNNQDAKMRLDYWMAQQSPPPPSNPTPAPQQGFNPPAPQQGFNPQTPQQGFNPQTPQQSFNPQTPQQGFNPPAPQQSFNQQTPQQEILQLTGDQRTVAIVDAPSGLATGIFLTQEGLVVTTRHAVRGELDVSVRLLDGRALRGQVIRSFPEYDIAFIQLPVQVQHLLPLSQQKRVAEKSRLIVIAHQQNPIATERRQTAHQSAPTWFPTTLMNGSITGAGGEVVLAMNDQNKRQEVVGLLTRNYNRATGFLYGVHISAIRQCYAIYRQETQFPSGADVYCNACGNISRAPSFSGVYCETCGTTLHHALERTILHDPAMLQRYDDDEYAPCPHCQARAGRNQEGECMRCGQIIGAS
jgi:hypothetical protein